MKKSYETKGGATVMKVHDEMREAAGDFLSENPAISLHII